MIKRIADSFLNKLGYKLVNTKKVPDTKVYEKLYAKESLAEKRFYNACGGGHSKFGIGFDHPLWRNLDLLRPEVKGWNDSYMPDKDFNYDMLSKDPLPIEDGKAEIIQTQFSIEHVHDEAARFFFQEAYRSLKPGGTLKVVAPNIELDYLAYINNDKSYFYIDSMSKKEYFERSRYNTPFNQASFEQVFLSRFAANATMIHAGDNPNKITDEEFKHVFSTMERDEAFTYCSSKCSVELQKEIRCNHINWWTNEKAVLELKKAGFNKVYIMSPGQSTSPVLRNREYIDTLWNNVAFFVEARKE